MKPLFRSILLLAFVSISCSAPNPTVTNSLAPTITRFSPDTAWTFQPLTISGTNFGYDAQNVRVTIDTALAQITDVEDTMVSVYVPEGARTGFLHVWSYEQTATFAKPVVVEYSFDPHSFIDSVPVGGSFSIPGTGMNNYHGTLRIMLNGVSCPVDSVFPDRIVSHVIPNSFSGQVMILDSNGEHSSGSLIVTRPCSWRLLSEIWDNLTVTETHSRAEYVNGVPNSSDSTWQTTATYSGQIDTNIGVTFFSRIAAGLAYSLKPPNQNYYPLFQISWDTVSQTATVSFYKTSYISGSKFQTGDTVWSDINGAEILSAPLPVDGDIEFSLSNFGYQITEDSIDAQGLMNWQETIVGRPASGSFDLILKR